MRQKLVFFILMLWTSVVSAQITDVYAHKDYEIATYVLELEVQKPYLSMKFEVLQDKNKKEVKNWHSIENQLYELLSSALNDEIEFFKIHQSAHEYLKNHNQWYGLQEFSKESFVDNPNFKRAEIRLLNVVNGFGVYNLIFDFEQVKVKKFYLANYAENQIIEIENSWNSQQQKLLENISLNALTTIYLLQTRKLDLDNTSRIRATQLGNENSPDFSSSLNYSEAVVYPYFNGLMLEFPANSKSSFIFDNRAFRLLIKDEHLLDVVSIFPQFQQVFSTEIQTSISEQVQQLDEDSNFDVLKFKNPPKDLSVLNKSLENIFSLKISNYYLSGDSTKVYSGSKKYFFNEDSQLIRVEERNDRNNVARETKFTYNAENQLFEERMIGYGNRLNIYYYDVKLLSYMDLIEINDYKSASGKSYIDLDYTQEHFVYNSFYRYSLKFNLIGEIERGFQIQKRYFDEDKFCTNNFCILNDENQNAVAVQQFSGSTIDLLINKNHQPIEAFFENDRYRYVFTYDDFDRIKSLCEFSDAKLSFKYEYNYKDDFENPLEVKQTNLRHSSSTTTFSSYQLEFWNDEL